jgi:glycolate oxidase FAD binding subunit
MVPLDPPFEEHATVGGIVAANSSGPRRRLYGSARDLVIGMRFATLEGKLIDTGGMVVKNVAGLDMGKLMIGSFGTLAGIASVNFKLLPIPAATRTFIMQFDTASAAIMGRDSILRSVLQPTAIDLLNPQSAIHLNRKKHLLLVQAGGSANMLKRYESELGAVEQLEGEQEEVLWRQIRNFTPRYLRKHPEGAVVRASCTLDEVQRVMELMDVPVIGRAGSGVCYGYFWECDRALKWIAQSAERGIQSVIEFAPSSRRASLELWPSPGSGFEVMKKIKNMFDPGNVLNRGRLYGRI